MSAKSILIIRCGALGDLVYATSVIDALKLQFGDDTIIDFVCTPGPGTLFNSDSRINRVFPLKHKKIPIFLSSQKKDIIKNSKKKAYDFLINIESGKQFKSLVHSVNAIKKVGYFFTDMTAQKNISHMVDITKLSFKNIISEDIFNKSFPKIVGAPNDVLKEKFNLDEKYIIISPSNSHQKRNIINYRAWQNDNWIELIKILSKEIKVVIVGNKGEDAFFSLLKPYPLCVVDLVGKTSLPELVSIINNAAGVVATDTGTAHMAAAANTEVFVLIGPTPAAATGPYKSPTNKVNIISANLPCSPCYKTEVMKNCSDNICMKSITTEQVYNSIKSANIL